MDISANQPFDALGYKPEGFAGGNAFQQMLQNYQADESLKQSAASTDNQLSSAKLQDYLYSQNSLHSGADLANASNLAQLPFTGQNAASAAATNAAEGPLKVAQTNQANAQTKGLTMGQVNTDMENSISPYVNAYGAPTKDTFGISMLSTQDQKDRAHAAWVASDQGTKVLAHLKASYPEHDFSDIQDALQTGDMDKISGIYRTLQSPKIQAAQIAAAGKMASTNITVQGANERNANTVAATRYVADRHAETALALLQSSNNTTDKIAGKAIKDGLAAEVAAGIKTQAEANATAVQIVTNLKSGIQAKVTEANNQIMKLNSLGGMNVPTAAVPSVSPSQPAPAAQAKPPIPFGSLKP